MSTWLRLHGQAIADSMRRIVAQPLASAMSIIVIAIALTLPLAAMVALRSAGAAFASLDTEPHVNVYLALDASDEDVKRVGEALRSHPDALRVRFISRAEALEELRKTTHLAEILAALERNPLPHAYTVRVRATEAARVAALRGAWSRLPKVEEVQTDFEWAARLARWVRFGERALWALSLALAAAVVFVVGHLIRLQVLTRRQEIEVSQLVGATAADVRRPFLYHGLGQGILAGLAAIGAVGAMGAWVGAELLALTPSYAIDLKVLSLRLPEAIAVVGASGALALLGAWLAVDREVRRFSAA